jgi:hypothetical protein
MTVPFDWPTLNVVGGWSEVTAPSKRTVLIVPWLVLFVTVRSRPVTLL